MTIDYDFSFALMFTELLNSFAWRVSEARGLCGDIDGDGGTDKEKGPQSVLTITVTPLCGLSLGIQPGAEKTVTTSTGVILVRVERVLP